MLRPAITNIEEDADGESPHTLEIGYHSSTPHTYTFEVSTLPWEDDEGPVAFCEQMEQGGETYSFNSDDLPAEVVETVEARGYTLREK
ncbi:hypothetical protein ACFQDD_00455 [Halorubrum pallidum]|uniref:Uncharacterized protein n=1 Tax=Halorubrum pallidum TaxID=1526114 RepID=A0ABD5T298_9EURY